MSVEEEFVTPDLLRRFLCSGIRRLALDIDADVSGQRRVFIFRTNAFLLEIWRLQAPPKRRYLSSRLHGSRITVAVAR
jgi:hypothetical protein